MPNLSILPVTLLALTVGCAGGTSASDASVPLDAVVDSGNADDVAMDRPTRDIPLAMDHPASDLPILHDALREIGSDVVTVSDVTAVDTGPTDPLAALAGCLGTASPLTISSQLPYLSVPVGSETGNFLLDYASTFSSIDLAAFAPPGPSTSGCNASELGVTCTVNNFAFLAPPGPVSLVTEDFSGVSGTVRQAGIIGTDFTSLRILALSYSHQTLYAASTGCTDAQLTAAGFVALSTAGFFTRDLSALALLSTVDSAASVGEQVPDVPTVPVRVAGAMAVAQLDTGFDDALVPFSVNVNTAFYNAIVASDPDALLRDAAHDLALTTCVSGVSENVTAYTLAAGRSLDFIADTSSVARSYTAATLFVKQTPAAAQSCGGIGTWTAPAAQVAASYFNEMGTLIFDPVSSRVWVLGP